MTKATKTKVKKKVDAKIAKTVKFKALDSKTPLKIVPLDTITIGNRNITNQLSEALKTVGSSRAMKGAVAYRVFELCKTVDDLSLKSRETVTDIMKANAKNPEDLDSKFEVHDQKKYMEDIEAFLDQTTPTKIPKFSVSDFQHVGLSATDYAALNFVFSDGI